MTRDYDTTIARIAGNIASGMDEINEPDEATTIAAAYWAVKMARAIVAEVKRTEYESAGVAERQTQRT